MAKPRKKKGALLKVNGTAVLLLSFATQNFFYQAWDARSAELTSAMRDRSLIDKGALLNEVLYFAARTSPRESESINLSALAEAKVSQAALKTAQSQAVAVYVIESISRDEKAALSKKLFAKAAEVRDYASLLSFFAFINDEYGKYSEQLNVEYAAIQAKRTVAKWIYLVLYTLGALVLLLGLLFEWRGAEE